MTTQEIEKLHSLYRRAGETARDEGISKEARDRALSEVVSLRKKIDKALMEGIRDSEVAAARAALPFLGGQSRTGTEESELRTLVRPVDPEMGLVHRMNVPLSFRTEYPIATGDASHTYGSYLVPASLGKAIVYSLISESAVLAAGPTTITTQAGNELTIPTLATEATADYRAEGSPAVQSTPAFDVEPLKAYNLSGYVQATQEFLTDCETGDTEAIVSRLCGRALGIKTATELAVGDGSDHIDGAFNSPTTGKTAASATSCTCDELLQLRASVSPAARKRARWVFSDDAYSRVALLMKDGDGNYIIKPPNAADEPDTLFGQPVFVDAYGPAVSASNYTVLYGDFNQAYAVRFVGGVEVTRSDYEGFTSWVSTYRFQVRMDAGWLDASAVKALKQSA